MLLKARVALIARHNFAHEFLDTLADLDGERLIGVRQVRHGRAPWQ